METASGPTTNARFPLLARAAVLVISVSAVVFAFVTYVPQDIGRLYPPANIIANTWYGPTLIIVVPLLLGWLALGVKRRWLRLMTLVLAVALLLACLNWIYVVREMSGTLPDLIRREHVL